MVNDAIDNNDDDIYLSDHSRSMRRACDYCIELFDRLKADSDTSANASTRANANTNRIKLRSIFREGYPASDDLRRASREHQRRRNDAHSDFWASTNEKPSTDTGDGGSVRNCSPCPIERTKPIQIETIQVIMMVQNDDDLPQEISPDQVRCFKDRFQNLNMPCLITGLDRSPHFRFVNQHWRNQSSNPPKDSTPSKAASSKINREWFREELGEDCLVPLRYTPLGEQGGDPGSSLDEDGRATECETKIVPVKEWIRMLETSQLKQQTYGSGQETEGEEGPNQIIYYLKDWHLQQRYPSTNDAYGHTSTCSLYTVPDFFGHDLLNSFLTRFTNGDYRFCYWGPSRSFTARHSDVMHSFSWSYNVVGTKEWTFYRSDLPNSGNSNQTVDEPENHNNLCQNDHETFTVIQETGQTIFVPATWQHNVVNLEETISINHNWITCGNIDLVWGCLTVEMVAIQNELKGWATSSSTGNSNGSDDDGLDQNMEACENMLRGCIGLDITGFVLMALVGLLEAATELESMPWPEMEPVSAKFSSKSYSQIEGVEGQGLLSTKQEELMFSVIRLASVLQDVSITNKRLVRLRSRLSAVLQSDEMAQRVERIVEDLIDCIQIS